MLTVAALYIDPRGPYSRMADVDCWDEQRDARKYSGPWPVVAHPPCGPWGALKHLYRGNEHDCAPRAVEQVQRWGGVLEHPVRSKLWPHCGLPLPGETRADGSFTIVVDQCDWGHVARKRTALYCVGIDEEITTALAQLCYGRGKPTHWVSGFRSTTSGTPKRYRQNGSAVPPGIKVCSAQQRRRTPPAFAEWLVSLARTVRRQEAA